MQPVEKGKVIRKEQCPKCASLGQDTSRDNLVIFTNGAWCYNCGENPLKQQQKTTFTGEYRELPQRKISKATCEKFDVQVLNVNGKIKDTFYTNEPGVAYNFTDSGTLIAQKIRLLNDKSVQFWSLGGDSTKLFGQHINTPSLRVPVVITEGEYDAMVVTQETGLPAVSITKGASGAAKQIQANLDWLSQWKYVILLFDSDEAGQKAVADCVPIFEIGTVKVAKLPLKDANDMLLANRSGDLKQALYDASIARPPSIVTPTELREAVLTRPKLGMPWPWAQMNNITYGFRTGEIYVVAAAESVGKTEFVKELMYHLIDNKVKVGVFSLEQNPEDTIRRMIGGKVNKRLHIPTTVWWDEAVINKELEILQDYLFLYNTKIASLPLDRILINIRYLVKCFGVKFIVIDNLTALCSSPVYDGKSMRDTEYVGLVMNKLFAVIKELDVTILVVSHLATDKISQTAYVSTSTKTAEADNNQTAADIDKRLNKPGMHWETGRVPRLENIYGSGTVRKLADFIIVLSRNRTSEDYNEHRTTHVKFLKTRIDSSNEGKGLKLLYDYDTGRLVEN